MEDYQTTETNHETRKRLIINLINDLPEDRLYDLFIYIGEDFTTDQFNQLIEKTKAEIVLQKALNNMNRVL